MAATCAELEGPPERPSYELRKAAPSVWTRATWQAVHVLWSRAPCLGFVNL